MEDRFAALCLSGNKDLMSLVDSKTISIILPPVKLSIPSINLLTSCSLLGQKGNLNKTLLRSSNCQSGIIGWFLSFFLKSLITNLLKLIGYPASKYFLAMTETSASNQKQF